METLKISLNNGVASKGDFVGSIQKLRHAFL